jgi:hypothetical protein
MRPQHRERAIRDAQAEKGEVMRDQTLEEQIKLVSRVISSTELQMSLFDEPLSFVDVGPLCALKEALEDEREFLSGGGAQYVGIEDALRLYLAQPRWHEHARERGSATIRTNASDALLRFVLSIVTDTEVRIPRGLLQVVSVSEATRIVSTHLAVYLATQAGRQTNQPEAGSARDSVALDALVCCVSRGEQDGALDEVGIDRQAIERAFQGPPGTVEHEFAVEFLLSPTGDFELPTPSAQLLLEALRRASFRKQEFGDGLPKWLSDLFVNLTESPKSRAIGESLTLMVGLLSANPSVFDDLLQEPDWSTADHDVVEWLISQIEIDDWDADCADGLFDLWVAGLRCRQDTVFTKLEEAAEEIREAFFEYALKADAGEALETFVQANFREMAPVIQSGRPAMYDDRVWCMAVELAWLICEARELSEIETLIQVNEWLSSASDWSGGVEDAGWSSIAALAQRIENCAGDIGRSLTSDEWEQLSGCVGDYCAAKDLISLEEDEEE